MNFFFIIIIFNLILCGISIFYLVFIIIDFLNFIIRKIPSVPTSSRTIEFILEIIRKKKDNRKTFVDLGCGGGKVLISLKKKYPEIEVIGYENWPTQFLLAKIMLFFSGVKAKIFYKDLFQADLTNAQIVFCYLYPHLMERLEPKLKKELKEGALIISNTFPLSNWQPSQILITNNKNPDFKKIFVYEKK